MLDTTSSNEIPLFGTTAMEGIVIQRPLASESYSWSDLSLVVQDDCTTSSYSFNMMVSPTTPSPAHSCSQKQQEQQQQIIDDASMQLSPSASESTFASTSTSSSETSMDSSTSKKSVRFAPSPKVRTYSLVLGDHPLCNDGLAIELGWEYCDETDENNACIDDRQNKGSCQKRPYLSRKQLLLDVAGCTKEELDQRSRELKAKKALIERNRSYREDYYYCLAFSKRR